MTTFGIPRQRCNVQPGDSGSPNYRYNSDGRVTVLGLTVGADPLFRTNVCQGNPDYWPNFDASARLFAVNITEAMIALQTNVITG